jgi:hypothetical protein
MPRTPDDVAMPAATEPAVGPWRCPRCDADRAAEDTFCGRCGARRAAATTPGTGHEPGADGAARDRPAAFPIRRALILNGIIVAAVVLAVVFSGNGGPGMILFEPATWRCDGTERTWAARLADAAPDLRIEWLAGGPAGTVLASSTTTRAELEPYLQADGTLRVTTTAVDAPECGLGPGTYTMAVRDAAGNALLAAGDVELAP